MAPVDQALDLGGLREPGQVIEPAARDRPDLEAHAERLFQPIGQLVLDHPSRGALIAGFYFVSEVGIAASFRIAAATNLAIGVIAIAASYAARRGAASARTSR